MDLHENLSHKPIKSIIHRLLVKILKNTGVCVTEIRLGLVSPQLLFKM